MPFKTREQRKLYMREYRKKHRVTPSEGATLADREGELAQILGYTKEAIQKRMHGKYSHLTLSPQEIEIVEEFLGIGQTEDCSTNISKKFLHEVNECVNCKTNPCVLIIVKDETIGLCTDHWIQLADSDVGW